jgi:hypothetical protein
MESSRILFLGMKGSREEPSLPYAPAADAIAAGQSKSTDDFTRNRIGVLYPAFSAYSQRRCTLDMVAALNFTDAARQADAAGIQSPAVQTRTATPAQKGRSPRKAACRG